MLMLRLFFLLLIGSCVHKVSERKLVSGQSPCPKSEGCTSNLLSLPDGTTFAACFYYDPKAPYANLATNPSWVWAKEGEMTIPLEGYYDGQFYVVTDQKITYSKILKSCNDSIPTGQKLLRTGAFQSQFSIYSYGINIPSDPEKSTQFDQIFVFGDSLSDTGNLQNSTRIVPLKPYWMGRFTNGRVWVEYLAHFLGNVPVENWAYGGATTGMINVAKSLPEQGTRLLRNALSGSLKDTIEDFVRRWTPSSVMVSHSLFAIWIGGNNYIEHMKSSSSFDLDPKHTSQDDYNEIDRYVEFGVQDIIISLEQLYVMGARQFMVGLLPNLAEIPTASYYNKTAVLEHFSKVHNAKLEMALERFKTGHNDVTLLVPKVGEAFYSKGLNGATLSDTACYEGTLLKSGALCDDQDMRRFFDYVHPTTLIHCYIGSAIAKVMVENKLASDSDLIRNSYEFCATGQYHSM